MSLFKLQDIILHSGQSSKFKIECDALDDEDIECVAWLGSQIVCEPFSAVVGIPRGGLRFATAIEQYITPGAKHHLIVDDVWTTGGSFKEFQADYLERTKFLIPTQGLIMFARGIFPNVWHRKAVFKLSGF